MEFDDIERILELVRQHDLAEFELERDGLKLRVRKASAAYRRCRRLHADAGAPARAAPSAAASALAGAAARRADGRRDAVELAVVKSPIVGTFYRSPEPGAPSFVESAQRVKKDQVLCIIEAMKLMNEITSEYDGEIVSAYVENGKPVQYGERLFAIKTGLSVRTTMFKKILIANRGEIALRVICACRELGIKTVAVYSEADENSLHVRFADEDVCIGPARSADSYLNVPAIISAAEITGADAIHPGYGFLSESAYLAEVCEACHIKFIGPAPNVIRLLGDKARARRAMKKAGVPILPGSDGPVDSEEKALKIAEGSRLSRSSSRRSPAAAAAACASSGRRRSCRKSLKTAQREAEAAFGVGDVYIEKYVEHPAPHRVPGPRRSPRRRRAPRRARVLDPAAPPEAARGGAVGRGDREDAPQDGQRRSSTPRAPCSTPTPARSSSCWTTRGTSIFIEVNTRVQVEHPVTEFITGVDIVKEQIRIAAGERLSFKQSDVTFTGHAIECRINAEDPETFAPSPGVIHAFSVPGGPGVRVDTVRALGVHDPAVLRLDDRQDHRARPRPPGSDRAHAAHARDDGHRRHQDLDSAAPARSSATRTSSPAASAPRFMERFLVEKKSAAAADSAETGPEVVGHGIDAPRRLP